jgi:hypothetical protein
MNNYKREFINNMPKNSDLKYMYMVYIYSEGIFSS